MFSVLHNKFDGLSGFAHCTLKDLVLDALVTCESLMRLELICYMLGTILRLVDVVFSGTEAGEIIYLFSYCNFHFLPLH